MLKRLRRLLQATIQDLVQKAGDPELELLEFVEDVELSLGEIRAEIEDTTLRARRLAAEAVEHQVSEGEWMAKAEHAAARDEDEVAKDALRCLHLARGKAEACSRQIVEAEASLATLRRDQGALEEKLEEARVELRAVSARLRRAEAERRSAVASSQRGGDKHAADRVHELVMETEAEGEAIRQVASESPDNQFSELDGGGSLDEELAALKRKVKGQGAEEP